MSRLLALDPRWFALFSLFSLFSLFAYTGALVWLGNLAFLGFLLFLGFPRRAEGTPNRPANHHGAIPHP
jgi:hypothetical protein